MDELKGLSQELPPIVYETELEELCAENPLDGCINHWGAIIKGAWDDVAIKLALDIFNEE